MQKSRLCLLVACVFLFSSVWSVAFATDNNAPVKFGQGDTTMVLYETSHKHEYAYAQESDPYLVQYESNGSATHSLCKYYWGVCRYCESVSSVVVIGTSEAHTFVYTGTNQHIVGESRHKYFYECGACGEVIFDTYVCPGTGNGDCIIITPGAYRGIVLEEK